MKGFIEVTRFLGRDEPGMPALVAVDAIADVWAPGHSQAATITLSTKKQADPELAVLNDSFKVVESFEEVQKRMGTAKDATQSEPLLGSKATYGFITVSAVKPRNFRETFQLSIAIPAIKTVRPGFEGDSSRTTFISLFDSDIGYDVTESHERVLELICEAQQP